MVLFPDDDTAYLEFLQVPSHRNGFILNTTRLRSQYAVLHRAHCHTIQGMPTAGQRWTTGDYRKVWASTDAVLQSWVSRELGTTAKPCGLCRPNGLIEKEANKGGMASPVKEEAGEVVVELATEGGGETIFRCRSRNGWVYWSDGSTIDMDEDDVDFVRDWHCSETEDFFVLLPSFWPHLSPLQIHPEWRDWFWKSYGAFLMGLDEGARKKYEAFDSRARRWVALTEGTDWP